MDYKWLKTTVIDDMQFIPTFLLFFLIKLYFIYVSKLRISMHGEVTYFVAMIKGYFQLKQCIHIILETRIKFGPFEILQGLVCGKRVTF